MTAAQLLVSTAGAPWLPPGSDAEVWVGDLETVPEPTIIVRLLLTRRSGAGAARFFCVPSAKGLDLPTRFLDPEVERPDPATGVARLVAHVLGAEHRLQTRCIGFVRNVVPVPDAGYPYPTPWAHVPVLTVTAGAEGDAEVDAEGDAGVHVENGSVNGLQPVVAGEWVALDEAGPSLGERHWWPVVEHHLAPARGAGARQ